MSQNAVGGRSVQMSWQSYAAAVPSLPGIPIPAWNRESQRMISSRASAELPTWQCCFCSLARGKDARRHRTCANQFSHDAVNPIDIEKMVVFTLRDENILLHTLEDTLKVVRRKASETIKRRLRCR